jgi:VanZ family protein
MSGGAAMPRTALGNHALTAAWALLLGVLLLLPAGAYDPGGQGWLDRLLERVPVLDQLAHALLFAVMARLAYRSFAIAGVGRGVLRTAAWTVASTVAYGLLLEALQGAIPGRSPSGLDMIANTVGAGLGAIMATSPGRSPHRRGRAPLATPPSLVDPAAEEPEP